MQNAILDFIERFKGSERTFLHGCCYWFAFILKERFGSEYPVEILHEPVEGHFVSRIGGRLYDVRGDVTDIYVGRTFEPLDDLKRYDPRRFVNLMCDCRDFKERDCIAV